MNILLLIGLFFTGVVTDIIWALYITRLAEHKKFQAAIYSVGTGICTIVFVEGLLQGLWYTIAWLIGLFIGTYYSSLIETTIKNILRRK